MPSERIHELGRAGVMKAHLMLWKMLGNTIHLPFTAYEHPHMMEFEDPRQGLFSFDLKGHLSRQEHPGVVARSVELFVEVKWYSKSENLLSHYKRFLRRAAVATLIPAHKDSLFLFFSNVPFGGTLGIDLCNGKLLKKCATTWPRQLKEAAEGLSHRTILCIATDSFQVMLTNWGQHEKAK